MGECVYCKAIIEDKYFMCSHCRSERVKCQCGDWFVPIRPDHELCYSCWKKYYENVVKKSSI